MMVDMQEEAQVNNIMEQVDDIRPDEARVNITWNRQNGDLPEPVNWNSTDADVKGWISEALRTGTIPGIPADANPNLQNFIVDRFEATEARPFNLIQIRPKTEFGARR